VKKRALTVAALVALLASLQPGSRDQQVMAMRSPTASVPASMVSADRNAAADLAVSTGGPSEPTMGPPARLRSATTLTAPPAAAPATLPQRPSTGQRGVTMLLYGNYDSDASYAGKVSAYLDHLKGLGVDSVSLTIPLFQSAWNSVDPHPDPARTPSVGNVRSFVQQAHQRGISILLRPLIDDQNLYSAHWRGTIDPSPNQAAWFNTYKAVLQPYAALGPSDGLDVLDVGSELITLARKYPNWWALIIDQLKLTYHGAVTYSTNWDWAGLPGSSQPYPSFTTQLDFLSIDAFYPLNAPINATIAQLNAAWQPWLSKVAQLRAYYKKTVVFTELGVTSQVGAYRQPWVWNPNTGLSLEAQRRYYVASCAATRPYRLGLYWWAYYSLDAPSSPLTDPGYDPHGKPAEAEIGHCYL
jgi:glycosyl hydrolase family 113